MFLHLFRLTRSCYSTRIHPRINHRQTYTKQINNWSYPLLGLLNCWITYVFDMDPSTVCCVCVLQLQPAFVPTNGQATNRSKKLCSTRETAAWNILVKQNSFPTSRWGFLLFLIASLLSLQSGHLNGEAPTKSHVVHGTVLQRVWRVASRLSHQRLHFLATSSKGSFNQAQDIWND